MNECQRLHETIVRDIYDVITSVKDFDQVDWINKRNSTGSIARRASNLVLVFPVLVSDSISYQTAMIVNKAVERKCASLMQLLFNSIQFSDKDTLDGYISQFHNNLDLRKGYGLSDLIDALDKIDALESGITITDRDAFEIVKEDMKNLNFYLDEVYNETSINDFKITKNAYGESSVELMTEAPMGVRMPMHTRGTVPTRFGTDHARYNKDTSDFLKQQLTQPQLDKANELMPTMMQINFIYTKDGNAINQMAVVGIKAKMYLVESMEIINRVVSKYKDSNSLFNLVRASTREISFFKDLAFAIDKAKIDAINMASDSNNAKMFKVLERRATMNKFMTLLKRNDASPITSLVMSQDEVEYLKKYNDVDMDKSHVTRSILDKFNLMDIVICDETLEIAKFLFDDGDSTYETITYDALEKEAKDSSYKKVVNLMSKINR